MENRRKTKFEGNYSRFCGGSGAINLINFLINNYIEKSTSGRTEDKKNEKIENTVKSME